jgi:hypothetical protein
MDMYLHQAISKTMQFLLNTSYHGKIKIPEMVNDAIDKD